MKIHPSALVSPGAQIADDVEIGREVIIGEKVEIGAGCVLQAHVVVEGRTVIGENNLIGYGSVLGAPPQDFAFRNDIESEVRIGCGNTFREYVTIHRGTRMGSTTRVGNDCCFLSGSHIGHNARVGDRVVLSESCLLGGYVEIGDGARLGEDSVFHQFCRIGTLASAQDGTRCIKDVPPYVLMAGTNYVSGVNLAGLRAAGWSDEACAEIERAFDLVYKSGLNVSQALEAARDDFWSPQGEAFFAFIASSKRGICSGRRHKSLVP
jgi:UDP-N-acetylglucosamine acyltransferase